MNFKDKCVFIERERADVKGGQPGGGRVLSQPGPCSGRTLGGKVNE